MTRADLQVNFRMPASLKAMLEAAAKENHRSLTAELIARLEASFRHNELVEETATASDAVVERSIHVQRTDGEIVVYTSDAIKEAVMRAFESIEAGQGPKPRKKYPK
jgi:hypothetical protein